MKINDFGMLRHVDMEMVTLPAVWMSLVSTTVFQDAYDHHREYFLVSCSNAQLACGHTSSSGWFAPHVLLCTLFGKLIEALLQTIIQNTHICPCPRCEGI